MPEPVDGTAADVMLFNSTGHLLQRIPAHGASAGSAPSIDLSAYPSGVYIIRLGRAVAKVVKQ
ncbi:MAG: T9SS type A sorting domain-containing protein [Bacteroidales bacterium]|nr:T9SS type A sorting domain-containing protein [Bacteroidales bacterium]